MTGAGDAGFDPVAFLSRLVAVPSCDPPGGELAVARLVDAQLAALGIESTLDEFLPGRANVLGRLPGTGARAPLVLSAHLDTVPVGGRPWRFDPFAGEVVEGRLRGRGAADMKGAVAAFVAAAARVKGSGLPLAGDVILAFTAGESASCLGARRLVEQGFRERIGAFLCGEPSGLEVITVEKAILWLTATATGEIGHVSGRPGTNAIDLMAEFLARLRGLSLDLPGHPMLGPPSVAVGRIEGGTAVNVTPDLCRAEIDVRFAPGIAPEVPLAQVAAVAPEGVALEIMDFKPAVETDPDSPFVRHCRRAVAARTGREPRVLGVSYYTDAAILMDGVDAPFAILGPGELGASGQPDESLCLDALHRAIDIYTDVIAGWQG